jgi:hypothetical protein
MRVPYTTKTGLKIGSRYTEPAPQMTRDEELIQSALLGLGQRQIPVWLVLVIVIAGYVLVSCATKSAGV